MQFIIKNHFVSSVPITQALRSAIIAHCVSLCRKKRIPSQKCRIFGINGCFPRIIPHLSASKHNRDATGFIFQITNRAKSLPAAKFYDRMETTGIEYRQYSFFKQNAENRWY